MVPLEFRPSQAHYLLQLEDRLVKSGERFQVSDEDAKELLELDSVVPAEATPRITTEPEPKYTHSPTSVESTASTTALTGEEPDAS